MTDIKSAFQNGKAFIPFVTAGDPDLETTEKLLIEMSKNGADIIEIGITKSNNSKTSSNFILYFPLSFLQSKIPKINAITINIAYQYISTPKKVIAILFNSNFNPSPSNFIIFILHLFLFFNLLTILLIFHTSL